MLLLQTLIGLGLLNVWLVRAQRPTAYRGRDAATLSEEFAAYGLPRWVFLAVGTLKVGAALALLAGIWIDALVLPAAGLVAALMLGALAMHLKVGDPPLKSLPAATMLLLSVACLWQVA